MTYNKEFLISELHRFEKGNDRIPMIKNMGNENGYPSVDTYKRYFGSWNKALIAAGFVINKTYEIRSGLETCCICNNYLKSGEGWITKGLPKGEVMCIRCYNNRDYMNSNLDINSTTGFGFLGQRIVAKTLDISIENDCNCSVNFGHPFDLYDKDRYNYIDVKSAELKKDNTWHFNLNQKETSDTYILVGFDGNRKNILHVWITDPLDDLTYDEKNERPKESISITNNINSGLNRAKPWEVDPKPYNDMLHSMNLDNCSVLRKQKKE